MTDFNITHFRCTECGATDSHRGQDPPVALICWSCKIGGRMADGKLITPHQQAAYGVGMLPVREQVN